MDRLAKLKYVELLAGKLIVTGALIALNCGYAVFIDINCDNKEVNCDDDIWFEGIIVVSGVGIADLYIEKVAELGAPIDVFALTYNSFICPLNGIIKLNASPKVVANDDVALCPNPIEPKVFTDEKIIPDGPDE